VAARVRQVAWPAVGAAALAALAYLCPARPTDRPAGGGPAPAAAGAAAEPDPPLEEQWRDVEGRIAARRRVVGEVIDGRLSLAEAAARFQEIDLASKSFRWEQFREVTPAATDEERECRAVLGHVEAVLGHDPARARAVNGRLEAELRGYGAAHRPRGPRADAARP
jgi:hypothetical protein